MLSFFDVVSYLTHSILHFSQEGGLLPCQKLYRSFPIKTIPENQGRIIYLRLNTRQLLEFGVTNGA